MAVTAEIPPSARDAGTSVPLLVVSGPTASGKSALGAKLAHALHGAIVSLDSVQCVQEFTVGSAKPSIAERALVPHFCIDLFPPDAVVTVQRLVEEAHASISLIAQQGRRPIVVGGSTMYLSALLEGLAEVPPVPESVRKELSLLSTEALFLELERTDPELAARLSPQDRQRIERGVSVYRATGQPLSVFHKTHRSKRMTRPAVIVVPVWSRAALYQRINERATEMCARGILDETRSLIKRHGDQLHSLRALGYAQCVQVLKGELPESALLDQIAMETRRFAKRQLTYFKNEPTKRGWIVRPVPVESSSVELVLREQGRPGKNRSQDLQGLPWTFPELCREIMGHRTDSVEVCFVEAKRLFEP